MRAFWILDFRFWIGGEDRNADREQEIILDCRSFGFAQRNKQKQNKLTLL